MDAKAIKQKINAVLKENLKFEEKEFVHPWAVDKATILLDARAFSQTPIDGERCCKILTKVLYLLNQGEQLRENEVTDFFFGVTKLFQSNHNRLRRMVYLVIKSLNISETEVFIVTSCLTKDMNSRNDVYRANAIKVLGRILDPSMAQQIDRYLKTAIVDKNAFVASSALVCGSILSESAIEVVRRWGNEIQEATTSKHPMVQFHALALLYELKKTDRLALHKVVSTLTRSSLQSPMAECLLVRYATQALLHERDQTVERTMMAYLDGCLRTKSEMVTFEAARAFCKLAAADKSDANSVFGYDFVHALTVLQIFLTSPKSVVRFGAIRALNELCLHRPLAVARCNADMEPLLTDSNRHIATLALTTLLKTGHESNVERLVKKITGFMAEISETFKIEVVRAVKGLCLQYPNKHAALLQFLANNLRDDGAYEFKKELVEALIAIVDAIPAAREAGLLYLAEFIEDCEYHGLSSRVLGFLGSQAKHCKTPAKLVRFLYNRLILETAPVRAAAVSALSTIANDVPDLIPDVLILLDVCANDSDDEVRDRIAHYAALLREKRPIAPEASFSLDALLELLERHCQRRPADLFDASSVPTEGEWQQRQARSPSKVSKAPSAPGAKPEERPKLLNRGPELIKVAASISPGPIGDLVQSGPMQPLTESEAEYTVSVVKHLFARHVMLEFVVSNTVPDVTLESIRVQLGNSPGWSNLGVTQIRELKHGDRRSAYGLLEKQADAELGCLVGRFSCALHFTVKEEGDDLGFEDDYPIEGFQIAMCDYVAGKNLGPGVFKGAWEALGCEHSQKFALTFKSLEAAVKGLPNLLGMVPCEKSDSIDPGARGTTMLLSGTFHGGHQVVAKSVVAFDPSRGCLLKITVRSRSEDVSRVICKALE